MCVFYICYAVHECPNGAALTAYPKENGLWSIMRVQSMFCLVRSHRDPLRFRLKCVSITMTHAAASGGGSCANAERFFHSSFWHSFRFIVVRVGEGLGTSKYDLCAYIRNCLSDVARRRITAALCLITELHEYLYWP